MGEGHEGREHGDQLRTGDAVVDPQPLFAFRDQTGLTQHRQMLRDVRLPAADERGQVADTFFAGQERFQQLQAGGMSKQAQESRPFSMILGQMTPRASIFRELNIVSAVPVRIRSKTG